MTVIYDRPANSYRFPILELLLEVQEQLGFMSGTRVRLWRIGGLGKAIGNYELLFEEDRDIWAGFSDILSLAQNPEETLDELSCIVEQTIFGISDSTCMFVQTEDKSIEARIVSGFHKIRQVPDSEIPNTRRDDRLRSAD